MDDDFIKKRLERDMAELKRLCEDHFAKRREDDAKMEELKERIVKTKTVSTVFKAKINKKTQKTQNQFQAREKSKQDRIAKELEKQARLELMRAELAKEEAEKAAQQESRKAEIMAGKIYFPFWQR